MKRTLNSPTNIYKAVIFLLYFSFFTFHFSFAQNKAPLVKQWDARFGGTDYENLSSFQQTRDGGYILGGYSTSGIGGDKTQNVKGGAGDHDYWIVKIDSLGNKQWDKDFGGTDYDVLTSFRQTRDGGYILGGYSESGISGDKTQDAKGDWDYWIVKIDSLGNKQWDKDFGGTSNDYFYSLQQSRDGGYILGGYSTSGIGGDKTQNVKGGLDYWIVKIDPFGNKQWDKDFGGTDYDALTSLQQTRDGGYVLGGYSGSGIGGDKTQNTIGGADYWIVKIDSLGKKQWDKDFGGRDYDFLHSLQQTSDGGYILGGYSYSGIGGDKTLDLKGGSDYWIVKIDSLGNKQWDKDFGGALDEDEFGNIFQTIDGAYLLAGTSYSPSGDDKTEDNLGREQSWVLKIDSLGNKLWDKTIFTNSGTQDDETGLVVKTGDGGIAVANYTVADTGGYKTQMSRGASDYWIVKFKDTSCTNADPGIITSGKDTVCKGSTTRLTVSGASGNIQWQSSANGIYYGEISGATSTAYNPTPAQSTYYRIKASNSCGVNYSSAQLINIIPNPTAGAITSQSNNICAGQTLVLNSTGSIGNIQWQSSANGVSFMDIQGDTSAIFHSPNLSQPTYYRVKAMNSCGIDSSVAKLIDILPLSVAGTIAQNRDSICEGSGITSNIVSSNTIGNLQWQSSVSGNNFSNISLADSASYTTPPALNLTTSYRLIADNNCNSDTSNIVTVHIINAPFTNFIYSINGKQVSFDSSGTTTNVTSYSWDFGDSANNTMANPTHTYNRLDTFNVCLTVYNGSNCSYTICKNVNLLNTGVANISADNFITLYPNPANNSITLSEGGLTGKYDLKIYNVLGQNVVGATLAVALPAQGQGQALPLRVEIPLNNLPAGTYQLVLLSDKEYYSKRFVKVK